MIVDCHTHIFEYPGHISEEFSVEANALSRGKPIDLHVPPARHWKGMANVDKAIVFGMRAFHSGIVSPNEYIADYVKAHQRGRLSDLVGTFRNGTRSPRPFQDL